MKEAPIEKGGDIDADLFSPEELEMMRGAEGEAGGADVAQDMEELQRQYVALARMIAEGGERERQLRALVNELSLLARGGDQHRAQHEQTQALARLVVASGERELQLQQCLEAVRNVALSRVRHII